MRSITLVAAIAVLAALLGSLPTAPVHADETGMAGIHTWRKVGKKTCLVDHFHDGDGTGTNQKTAELAAVRSWQSFTDLEYGSDWANFKYANSKAMKCANEGGARWSCRTEAVPCRAW
jgi:hypothetical protein